VLDGDPAPPKKRHRPPPPLFGTCLLWPNGWMDQDATWNEGRSQPRPRCVRWDPACFPGKWHSSPPSFWPMSIVAKRSPISATAELLLYFACDVDNAKCIVVMHVCVSVAVCPHCCTDPDVTWGVVGDAPYLCTIGRICNRRMGCVAMAT